MRNSLILISFLLAFVMTSCINEKVSIPDHIIERDTLINILAEIQIIEAIKQVKTDRQSLGYNVQEGYEWEFEKYNVTEERFKESIDFYSIHQDLFEEIYNDVIIRITEIEAEFTSKNQK